MMLLVVMAFGIAIPNVLSRELVGYQSQAGSAGALFGLMYYTLIGSGLALAGMVQNLGGVGTLRRFVCVGDDTQPTLDLTVSLSFILINSASSLARNLSFLGL